MILHQKTNRKKSYIYRLERRNADKGDYQHFMMKEIMDQKETITKAITLIQKKSWKLQKIKGAYGTYFVGCGTAGKVAMVENICLAKLQKHVNVKFGLNLKVQKL